MRTVVNVNFRDTFEESKHPREGGKFASKGGGDREDLAPGSGDGKIKDKHGKEYRVQHEVYNGKHEYRVKNDEGHTIADVTMSKKLPGSAMHVGVSTEHQRKGLATALYNHIEKHRGEKMKPNWATTPEGAAFWEGRQAKKGS